MPPGQYQARIQNMDYLGLVPGMCKELEIDDHIDSRVPKVSDDWNVSCDEAIVGISWHDHQLSGIYRAIPPYIFPVPHQ